MNTTNHISPDDLNLFALQLLPDAAMKDAAAHLKECAECRAWLGEIQRDLVTYALTAELHTPPPQARERLLRQVAEEKKVIPIARCGGTAADGAGAYGAAAVSAQWPDAASGRAGRAGAAAVLRRRWRGPGGASPHAWPWWPVCRWTSGSWRSRIFPWRRRS